MKIGSKIALFYTIITVGAIAAVVLVFYFFTSRYINNLYDSYLAEKAYLTAQKHWEKDEVDELSYYEIQQKYNELLPQAREILLNKDSIPAVTDTLNKYLDRDQQIRLFKNNPVSFVYGKLRGSALYYPDNEGNFVVLVMANNNYGYEIQKHILLLTVLLLLVSCGFIYLIGRLYSNRILQPLQHLLKDLGHIRGNNLSIRLKTLGNKDELDELIRTLNDMLDRINIAFQAEKSFISNASHELNNPLTAIQGECEISLMKERAAAEYIEALQRIATESKRISRLIKHLLFLSRQDDEILQNTEERIALLTFLRGLCLQYSRVEFKPDKDTEDIYIIGDSHLLGVAFCNLIENARKYSRDTVVVSMARSDVGTVVEIEDRGIGIPEKEISHVFHSFYRASNTREYAGHGIGLSLSMKILSVYGGKIKIESRVNAYTKVIVTFNRK